MHYQSQAYPFGLATGLLVCEPNEPSRPWLNDQYYNVCLSCGGNVCEGYVWRSLVESVLLEPMLALRWESSGARRAHEEVMSLTDGEFWDMAFDYGGVAWALRGHCRYPDKYQEVRSGMIRTASSLLVTQAFSNYDVFSEKWYKTWCRVCRKARPNKWKEPYDEGAFARFMDAMDDFSDKVHDVSRRFVSDVSVRTLDFLDSFEE